MSWNPWLSSMPNLNQSWISGIGLILLLSLAGCEWSAWGIERQGKVNRASLPPCVDDDCHCGDFRDQASAQQVLEAFSPDLYELDRDGDGQACEGLPSSAAPAT